MRLALLVLAAVAGCSGRASERAAAAPADTSVSPAAIPVTVADVRRATLTLTITAPGRTEVLRPVRVRAPFTGTLLALTVADGDLVNAGQDLGTVVARASAAALVGARAMLEAAQTDQERADAQRAVELTTGNLVKQPLRAPAAGVVVSHVANGGDLVNEGDDVLTIAPQSSIAFIAQVVQSDLAQVQPGQSAQVALAARATPLDGAVHGILPSASPENMSAPVRIDFRAPPRGITLGLFGTARITVGYRRDVPVVPTAAVLRDDVYGTSRLAIVNAEGRARWVTVTTGARESDLVEVLTPVLAQGTKVIVAGQVGLPDSAAVRPDR